MVARGGGGLEGDVGAVGIVAGASHLAAGGNSQVAGQGKCVGHEYSRDGGGGDKGESEGGGGVCLIAHSPVVEEVAVVGLGDEGALAAALGGVADAGGRCHTLVRGAVLRGVGGTDGAHGQVGADGRAGVESGRGGDFSAIDAKESRSGGVASHGEGEGTPGGEEAVGGRIDGVVAVGGGSHRGAVLVLPATDMMQCSGLGVDGHLSAREDMVDSSIGIGVNTSGQAVACASQAHAAPLAVARGEGQHGIGGEVAGDGHTVKAGSVTLAERSSTDGVGVVVDVLNVVVHVGNSTDSDIAVRAYIIGTRLACGDNSGGIVTIEHNLADIHGTHVERHLCGVAFPDGQTVISGDTIRSVIHVGVEVAPGKAVARLERHGEELDALEIAASAGEGDALCGVFRVGRPPHAVLLVDLGTTEGLDGDVVSDVRQGENEGCRAILTPDGNIQCVENHLATLLWVGDQGYDGILGECGAEVQVFGAHGEGLRGTDEAVDHGVIAPGGHIVGVVGGCDDIQLCAGQDAVGISRGADGHAVGIGGAADAINRHRAIAVGHEGEQGGLGEVGDEGGVGGDGEGVGVADEAGHRVVVAPTGHIVVGVGGGRHGQLGAVGYGVGAVAVVGHAVADVGYCRHGTI